MFRISIVERVEGWVRRGLERGLRRESGGRESETERVFGRAGRAHNPPELLLLLKTALLRIFGSGATGRHFGLKGVRTGANLGLSCFLSPTVSFPSNSLWRGGAPPTRSDGAQ